MRKYSDIVFVVSVPGGQVRAPATASVQVNQSGGGAATIYSDDGVTLQANPITTDSSGEYSFYAASGLYDLVISVPGFTTETKIGAVDLFDSVEFAGYGGTITPYMTTVLDDATADAVRVTLGATTTGDALFVAATAAAARTILGAGATGDTLFAVATAADARTILGSTSIGDALFIAATNTAARALLGSTTVGDAVFIAANAAAARTTLGATTVGDAVFIAASAAAARTAIGAGGITLATEIGAGGTSMDWTGIPSGVKHITIMGVGISSNGVAGFICQIGDSGGLETAGYASYVTNAWDGASSVSLTAFHLTNATASGSGYHFKIVLDLENASTNTWVSSSFVFTGSIAFIGCGSKALSGTLDRVRFNANGDTIDLGAVNISYEGHP